MAERLMATLQTTDHPLCWLVLDDKCRYIGIVFAYGAGYTASCRSCRATISSWRTAQIAADQLGIHCKAEEDHPKPCIRSTPGCSSEHALPHSPCETY